MLHYDVPVIESFKELLNEVVWSWDFPSHDIVKTPEGYTLNKMYIEPEFLTYKTDRWILGPGVYEDFERFYKFLQTTDKSNV